MNALHSFLAVGLVSGVAATLAAAQAPSAVGNDAAPATAKGIIEVVEQLEAKGYGPIVDIDFDRGNWEVEAYKGDVQFELVVDGRSGQVLHEYRDDAEPRPPQGALSLSRLLKTLKAAGYDQFEDASFERRYWDVDCHRNDGPHDLHVDPITAKVVSDRLGD